MRKNLSIYIHIPFCVKKCVYCDFLSFGADDPQINRSGAVRKAYVQSICRELLSYKSISKDYIVRTIFIGGGTPSILLPGEIMNMSMRSGSPFPAPPIVALPFRPKAFCR